MCVSARDHRRHIGIVAEAKSDAPPRRFKRQAPAGFLQSASQAFIGSDQPMKAPHWLGPLLAAIFVLALVLRTVWLDHVPTNITADEADNLRDLFSVQEKGKPDFFGLDWKPSPAFSIYLFHVFAVAAGDEVVGMRFSSALLSALALVPFFALARRVVAIPVALAGTVLLATNAWYLHFSRSGWENVHVALYALLAAWALTVGIERSQLRWFALAGTAAALGLYGYFAGRLILPALLVYFPFALLHVRRRQRLTLAGRSGPQSITIYARGSRCRTRTALIGFAVLTVVAVALFVPQWRVMQREIGLTDSRTEGIFVLNQERPYLGHDTAVEILGVQLWRTISGFLLGDGALFGSARYSPPGEPIFDPVTNGLLLLGLVVGLWRWRATALWWCLLFVPLLATQVLTSRTPDAARAVPVVPFFYLFVTLGLQAVWARLPVRRGFAVSLLAALVAILAAVNVQHYITWIQMPAAAEAREPAISHDEYEHWEAAQRCDMERGGDGFNVSEWKEMRMRSLPGCN
jgi:hypothetical protein